MAADSVDQPAIHVLAGTNGAGKSSIGGAAIRRAGGEYFNPDEAARQLRTVDPGITVTEANSRAWLQGRRLLERAIAERLDFAFETTLGGDTIPRLLDAALAAGIAVRVWYVGLEGAELHIARVRARAAAGGHDIPAAKIRERYDRSRLNLVRLLPRLTDLRVYDNSVDGDPRRGLAPQPRLVLYAAAGTVVTTCALDAVPQWAKPIVAAGMRLTQT